MPPDLLSTNTCDDPLVGYRVTYPGNWSTNVGAGGVPTCRAFSDIGVFDVPNTEVPTYVRVVVLLQSGVWPKAPAGTLSERMLTVAGRPAVRWEIADPQEPGTAQVIRVLYVVELPADAQGGDYLVASTATHLRGAYDVNVTVLDWMMERLEVSTIEN